MRDNLIPSIVAAVVFGATVFPAVHTGLGLALPASQTIIFPVDPGHAEPESQADASRRSEFVRQDLSFRESLSAPESGPGLLLASRSYQLRRNPHPLLFELAAAVSMLIAVGAGLALNARATRRQR